MNLDHQPIKATTATLQVMICTYGRAGIERVAASSHPKMEGVEYLVCIQQDSENEEQPLPQALSREDFKIYFHRTKGLSVNRNMALSIASAPILLISDDDADYTEEGLQTIIDAFRIHTDADLITFKYATKTQAKTYPSESYDISKIGRRHNISSIELTFRRKSVQGRIWFNENFGIGAQFPSGEEDVFLQDCLDNGLQCVFIPSVITRHEGTTTSGRNLKLPSRAQTKGAVFLHLHPHDWILRMLVHTLREIPQWRKGLVLSPLSYCINWLKGAWRAQKEKVFPTPDYSKKYLNHDSTR